MADPGPDAAPAPAPSPTPSPAPVAGASAPFPVPPPPRPKRTAMTTAADWRTLHLWQIQPVRDVLVIGLAVGVVWLGYKLSAVTVPMLLALLLAYLVEPLVRRMTRFRPGGRRAFTRSGVAWLLIGVAAFAFVVPAVVGTGYAAVQGVQAVESVGRGAARLRKAIETPTDQAAVSALGTNTVWRWVFDRIAHAQDQTGDAAGPAPGPPAPATPGGPLALRDRIGRVIDARRDDAVALVDTATQWLVSNAEALSKQALGAGTQAVGVVARGLLWLGGLGFSAFLTAFFFYFFCTGWGRVLRFSESLIPERRKGRAFDMLDQMDHAIAGFVRGRLTIALILGAYYTLAYAVLGVPAWTIVGPIVGVLTIVPYASAAAVPVVMLLLWLNAPGEGLASHWWFIVGGPIVAQLVQQFVDDYFLTPRIQGEATGMNTPTILFASIAGGLMAGFYGLLLAIPVAACIKILLKEVFWPRVKAWAEGREEDILPIDRG